MPKNIGKVTKFIKDCPEKRLGDTKKLYYSIFFSNLRNFKFAESFSSIKIEEFWPFEKVAPQKLLSWTKFAYSHKSSPNDEILPNQATLVAEERKKG